MQPPPPLLYCDLLCRVKRKGGERELSRVNQGKLSGRWTDLSFRNKISCAGDRKKNCYFFFFFLVSPQEASREADKLLSFSCFAPLNCLRSRFLTASSFNSSNVILRLFGFLVFCFFGFFDSPSFFPLLSPSVASETSSPGKSSLFFSLVLSILSEDFFVLFLISVCSFCAPFVSTLCSSVLLFFGKLWSDNFFFLTLTSSDLKYKTNN